MDETIHSPAGRAGTAAVADWAGAAPASPSIPEGTAQRIRSREAVRRAEVRAICRRHFAMQDLPMRFVDVVVHPGGRLATIFFSAETRVDYRALFRDLCRELRMVVRMERLGPRDEARRTGTCGPCGRPLCCRSFLSSLPAVSVRVVKEQGFPLSTDRSAGICGRLKCCLTYETAHCAQGRGDCGVVALPPASLDRRDQREMVRCPRPTDWIFTPDRNPFLHLGAVRSAWARGSVDLT